MLQEVKASTLKKNGKTEDLNNETEDIKRTQMEITDLKNTIMEIENSLDGFIRSREREREREQTVKLKTDQEKWDNLNQSQKTAKKKKSTVSCTCGTAPNGLMFVSSESQVEKRKSVKQKKYLKTMSKKLPNFVKDTILQI